MVEERIITPIIINISILVNIFLLIFIFLNVKKSKATILFIITVVLNIFWSIGESALIYIKGEATAAILVNIMFATNFLFPAIFLVFVFCYLKIPIKLIYQVLVYFVAVIFAILALTTKLFINGVMMTNIGYRYVNSETHWIHTMFFVGAFLVVIFVFIGKYITDKREEVREPIRIIGYGMLLIFFINFMIYVPPIIWPLYDISFIPFGSLFVLITSGSITYALFKYDF